MRKLLTYILLFISIAIFSQDTPFGLDYKTFPTLDWLTDTVYIDPSFGNGGDGTSPASPFNEFSDFTWTAKTAYLIQRGDSIVNPPDQSITADSMYLGAYGTGRKPLISGNSTSHQFSFYGTHQYVQNLRVVLKDTGNCFRFRDNSGLSTTFMWADSLETYASHKGMEPSGWGKIYITNPLIQKTRVDGIYASSNDTIVVYGGQINDISHAWEYTQDINTAGGDCIQAEGNNKVFIVDNSFLDKSDYPGKFAFISNGTDTVIVINCHLKGYEFSTTVYHGSSARGWHYSNNVIEGGNNGLWVHSKCEIINNIFLTQGTDAIRGSGALISNNIFINSPNAITGGYSIFNNIFYNCGTSIGGSVSEIKAYNNNYYNSGGTIYGTGNVIGNPLFNDFANGDYTLQAGSPLIDVGKPTWSRYDAAGNNQPYNGKFDIGAYEYGATTSSDNTVTSEYTWNDTVRVNIYGVNRPKTGFINTNCESDFFLHSDSIVGDMKYGLFGFLGDAGSQTTISEWDSVGYSYMYLNSYSSDPFEYIMSGFTNGYYKINMLIRGGSSGVVNTLYTVGGVEGSVDPYQNNTLVEIDSIIPVDGVISIAIHKQGSSSTGYLCGFEVINLDAAEPPCDLSLSFTGISDTDESSTGQLTVNEGGGTAPYTYLWSNEATTKVITGLYAGIYSVVVTDNVGCENESTVILGNTYTSDPCDTTTLIISGITPLDSNNQEIAGIDISIVGGVAPYTYLWSNDSTTQDLTALGAGTYSVTVTDDNSCLNTAEYTIYNYSSTELDTIKINFTEYGQSESGWFNLVEDYISNNGITIQTYGVQGGNFLGTSPITGFPDLVAEIAHYPYADNSMYLSIKGLDSESTYTVNYLSNRTPIGEEVRNQYSICQDDTLLINTMDTDNNIATFTNVIPVGDSIFIEAIPVSSEWAYFSGVEVIKNTEAQATPIILTTPFSCKPKKACMAGSTGSKVTINSNGKIFIGR